MMHRRKSWFFLWILVPVLILGIFGYLLYHYLFDPNLYKRILEESLSELLHKGVFIEKASFSLWDGIGFVFEDVHVKEHPQGPDLFYSRRMILQAKLRFLLKGELRWKRIVLDEPVFHLLRDREGRFNLWGDILTSQKAKRSPQKLIQIISTLFGGSLRLQNGKFSFSDESLGPTPLLTEMKAFHFSLSEVSHGKPFPFRLSARVVHSNQEGQMVIHGTIQSIPEDMDLSKGSMDAKVELKDIETRHFWPYLKSLLPMEMLSGVLDLTARYQGDFRGGFNVSGSLRCRDLILDYPKVFAHVIQPKWMKLNLDLAYNHQEVTVPLLSIELPELWVKAKGKIYGIGSNQMGLDAEAQTGSFDLSEGKKFIPFRIITRDVSKPLFHAEGNGPVQILSVRLSGKMPEIEHCDQPQYAHVLSVEMALNGIRLKLPWDLPAMENLKGRLSYRNGNLQVIETQGRVFRTNMNRVNGTFYQLLQIPTLQAQLEGKIDLRDLPSLIGIKGLVGDLSNVFSPIQIDFGYANYHLVITGVLKAPLHFQHRGSYHLEGVRFTHQQIPFTIAVGEGKIDLSNAGIRWSDARVGLGACSFRTDGSWGGGGGDRSLELVITGEVDLKNFLSLARAPLFSERVGSRTDWIEQLTGRAGFFFKGQSRSGLNFSSYEGSIAPQGIRLRPKGISSPLVLRGGSLSFSPLAILFSKMKVSTGLSFVTLDGDIKGEAVNLSTQGSVDLKDLFPILQSSIFPEAVRTALKKIEAISGIAEGHARWSGKRDEGARLLKEGEIHLKGLSLKHQEMMTSLAVTEGTVFLYPERVQIIGFQGSMGNSPIAFAGTVSRLPGTRERSGKEVNQITFQLSSPSLDLDSFFSKKEEEAPLSLEKLGDWLSSWTVRGQVKVEQGRYRGLSFQDLRVEMETQEEKLVLKSFQFRGLGGDLWSGGWLEPVEKGVRFEITPRLSNMDASAFLRMLLQKGEEERVDISGRLHFDRVDLRGEGGDFQSVKESLQGGLRLEMENGVIRRWKTLARIFSILNVSQWFWGRLPDLKSKGLPYRQIVATVRIKDGIASTEDFVVQSDAIRITLLGKIDLVKNQIDATIGVHPLVTVDMILSHLPVAGYILTGEDKAFLSYVYEVKGDLNDPKIEAVPLKGLGQNLWGIIQRLLETPLRPFQTPNNKKN